MWVAKQQIARSRRGRVWAGAFLCWAFLMLATPKIPYSPKHHAYADMRNFFGAEDGILLPFLSFLLPLCLHVLYRECAWRAFVCCSVLSDGSCRVAMWVLRRCAQHAQCDHQFPVLDCGRAGLCSVSSRELF